MTKTDLHRLVDELPDESIEPVGRLLERAQDPVIARLDAAPADDEPLTDGDLAEIRAGLADTAPSLPWEQAKRELAAD
jgi:hypothetical protein